MNIKLFLRNVTLGLATAMLASTAFAMNSPQHQREAIRYGVAAQPTAATRTVNLDAGAKYLNVYDGETVTIIRSGQSFTWNFSTIAQTPFALEVVAPKEFSAGNVRVYVAPDPNRLALG